MCSLTPELATHGQAPAVHHLLIPRGGDCNASRKDANVVFSAERRWPALEAQFTEVQAWNGLNVPYARTRSASDHIDPFGKLAYEGLDFRDGVFPSAGSRTPR